MVEISQPTFFIIAGPNGAGKSSFVENNQHDGEFLQDVAAVDPDAIARRIDPDNVFKFVVQAQAANALRAYQKELHTPPFR